MNFQNFVMNLKRFMNDNQGNPDTIIQNLMQQGKITQEQYNQALQQAKQIQQNPMFNQLMK